MNKKSANSRLSLSARFTMLAVFLIASMILSVRFGSTNVPLSDILSEVSAFISTGRPAETASSMILWQIRIPRTIFAAFCGMGLSLCGLVLQTMTRNDLADPYVLGVSSGASTGAVIAIIWGWFSFFGNYNVSAGAFIGAAVSTIIVTMCAGKSTSPIRLILVGMGVSALFSALTMMIIYGAKHEAQVRSAMFWLLGSLSGMQWSSLPHRSRCRFYHACCCLDPPQRFGPYAFRRRRSGILGYEQEETSAFHCHFIFSDRCHTRIESRHHRIYRSYHTSLGTYRSGTLPWKTRFILRPYRRHCHDLG